MFVACEYVRALSSSGKYWHRNKYEHVKKTRIDRSMQSRDSVSDVVMLREEYKNISTLSYLQQLSNILKYYRNQEGYHKALRLKGECDAPIFSERNGKLSLSSKITLAPDTPLIYFFLAAVLQSLRGKTSLLFWSERAGLSCRKCVASHDIRRWTKQDGVLHSRTDAHPVFPLARCPQ